MKPRAEKIEEAQLRFLQETGAAIQARRESRKLTQQELARQAGISRSHLIEIEAGKNTSLATIARLCFVLGIQPQHLGTEASGDLVPANT